MDDLIKQMKETDSQLSLLGKQIERHEKYGDDSAIAPRRRVPPYGKAAIHSPLC